jgi:DNA helicase-2/ATP-dependent DNA helicase PcrA
MRRAAERLVERYVRQYQQDLLRTWSVERPFELKLSDANVTGRADVILDAGAGLTLVDYKTRISPDADEDFFTQLAVYAAAGRREGLDVRSAWLHDLSRDGQDARIAVPVDDAVQERAVDRVQKAVEGIRRQQFEARPGALCAQCDVRAVCRACPQAAR